MNADLGFFVSLFKLIDAIRFEKLEKTQKYVGTRVILRDFFEFFSLSKFRHFKKLLGPAQYFLIAQDFCCLKENLSIQQFTVFFQTKIRHQISRLVPPLS